MEVYLLHDRDRDLHKIGVSTDPVRRQRQLQTGNPGILALSYRFATPRAHQLEASLHAFYGRQHTLGEWFDLEPGERQRFAERCRFFDAFHERRNRPLEKIFDDF